MAYSCPHCGQQLANDPNDATHAICYSCRKRYQISDLEKLEATRNSQVQQQPQQPIMQQPSVAQNNTMQYQSEQPPQQEAYGYPQAQQPVYQQQPQYDPYQQQSVYPPQYAPQTSGTSGLSVISLITGILGICGAWIPVLNFFSLVFGGAGLACGLVARSKIKKGLIPTEMNSGLSIAGVVTSIISIVFMILTTFGYCALISVSGTMS